VHPSPLSPFRSYVHRPRAGNAGDIWKHLVLTSLVDTLIASRELQAIYAESHAGRPRYRLRREGGWQVVCWFMLDLPRTPCPTAGVHRFEILFREMGMEYHARTGACVLATPVPPRVLREVESQLNAFRGIMKPR
jgi:hypothetical protein